MALLGTLVAKLVMDKADFVKGAQGATEQSGFLEKNMLAISAAGVAAGGAMEVAARKQAPLTESTQRLAGAMEMNEQEMRDLALATTDVTFPIEDVLEVMEKGRQQGIDSAEGLKDYAEFWDMVGDATGENAAVLAESGAALRAVGIDAGNEAEALSAFGYVAQETSGDVGEFIDFIDKTGPELREMGADVDDAAGIMGVLEHEFGMTARTARQEFRKAVNEADGDMGEMLDTLGISEEQFGEYSQAVSDSSEVIEKNADLHGESYTVMEKLQQKAEELQYQYGDLIGVVGDFAPLMMGLGPILKGVTTAKSLLGKVSLKALVPGLLGAVKATWAFTAALLANPITWIVILIVGLIAAIYLLWKNWDQVSDWLVKAWEWIKNKATETWEALSDFFSNFWEGVKGVFSAAWEWIKDLFFKYHPLGWVIDNWEEVKEFFVGIWDSVKEIFSSAWEWIKDLFFSYHPLGWVIDNWEEVKEFFVNLWESIKETAAAAWGSIKDFVTGIWDSIREAAVSIWNALSDWLSGTWDSIQTAAIQAWESLRDGVVDTASNLVDSVMDIINSVLDWIDGLPSRMIEYGKNIIQGLINGIKSMGGAILNAITGVVGGAVDSVKSFLGLGSPSRLFEGFAVNIGEGLVKGATKMQRTVSEAVEGLIPEPELPAMAGGGGGGGIGPAPGHGGSRRIEEDQGPTNHGGGGVTNNFNIEQMNVRDDQDVEKIARELYRLQNRRDRGVS